MFADENQHRAAGLDGAADDLQELFARLDLVEVHEHVLGAKLKAELVIEPASVT